MDDLLLGVGWEPWFIAWTYLQHLRYSCTFLVRELDDSQSFYILTSGLTMFS